MISAAPLRRMMVERDMTWELLSQATGLSYNTLRNINNGACINNKNLDILCKVLQCQPKDLIRYTEEEE